MRICFSKHCHNNILFDILVKYSSQYSKSITFSCWTLSIHFFKIHISATFHLVVVARDNFEKIISSFLFVWFYDCHGRQKYKPRSFVYRFQALNSNSIENLRFISCRVQCSGFHQWTLFLTSIASTYKIPYLHCFLSESGRQGPANLEIS